MTYSTATQLTPSEQTHQAHHEVTGGVDTHKDTHTVAALDASGRLLGHREFAATPAGYAGLLGWLRGFGQLVRVGIEGTGVYGAGLAGYLQGVGVELVEVDRPDRKTRRWQGKSDPVDAEAAARAAQSGRATGIPKTRGGQVDALRALRTARRSAVAARAEAQTQMKALILTAPEPLRTALRGWATASWSNTAPPAARTGPPPATPPPPPCSHCARWPVATSSSPPRSTSSTP